MIILQTDKFEIDLSRYGLDTKERSSMFSDNIYGSYSLPFVITEANDIIQKIGFPTMDNIIMESTALNGRLRLPQRHYKCQFYIESHKDNKLECRIEFGEDKPAIFDVDISDLNWDTVITPDIKALAESKLNKEWPEVQENYPMVFDNEIQEDDNYDKFLGFINNYDDINNEFLTNEMVQETDDNGDPVNVPYNRNVLVPCVYLMEILRKIYAADNKVMIGEAVSHPKLTKAVYVPDNYLEKLDSSQYFQWSFGLRENYNNQNYQPEQNFYQQLFNPTAVGSYKLKIKVNLPANIAGDFRLEVRLNNPILKLYESNGSRVDIDDTVTINVEDLNGTPEVDVRMFISYTDINISEYNSFEIAFDDGAVNVFPNVYSLSDFVPEMTCGEYINMMKDWFNLRIRPEENYVKIDFIENNIGDEEIVDHEHLRSPDAEFKFNNNRYYKLTYEDGQRVNYTRDGQIQTEVIKKGQDEVKLENPVRNLPVVINEGTITATREGERADMDFVLYDGSPIISDNSGLSLQNVFDEFWKKWVKTRINGKEIEEDFTCSIHEDISIDKMYKKHNELCYVKELDKKYNSDETMEVKMVMETI